MKPIGCEEAMRLLDDAWHGGLQGRSLKNLMYHLTQCPGCAATAAQWWRLDARLDAFCAAFDGARARHSIADRVYERIAGAPAREAAEREQAECADLVRLIGRLQHDSGLRQRLAQALDREAAIELLSTLGAEQGLCFSASTVRAVMAKQQAANDGELSDEQLEAVAGGAAQQLTWLQEWVGRLPPAAGAS